MSIQSINDSINNKMADTNQSIDKSIAIRSDRNDKERQKQLEEFDKAYLDKSERERIRELNEAEDKQIKESRKYAAMSTVNGAKIAVGGVIGKTFGVAGALDNTQKLSDSEKKLSTISDAKDNIRSEAYERMNSRFDKANELTSNIKTEPDKDEEVYYPGKRGKYMQ